MSVDRQHVYEAIEGERLYQDNEWPRSRALPATGEVLLLQNYIGMLIANYQQYDDGEQIDVPEQCLHDLRKIAAIAVRAMENAGVRYRFCECKDICTCEGEDDV